MQVREISEKLEQFEARCRGRGLPLTVQRRVILEVVLGRDDHPTVDEVYEAARSRIPGVSRTTVYRVLQTLVELEVIRRVHHPEAVARFDGRTSRHHHLVCLYCNCVIDYESPPLDRLPMPEVAPHGFEIDGYSVQLTGTCESCKKERGK